MALGPALSARSYLSATICAADHRIVYARHSPILQSWRVSLSLVHAAYLRCHTYPLPVHRPAVSRKTGLVPGNAAFSSAIVWRASRRASSSWRAYWSSSSLVRLSGLWGESCRLFSHPNGSGKLIWLRFKEVNVRPTVADAYYPRTQAAGPRAAKVRALRILRLSDTGLLG